MNKKVVILVLIAVLFCGIFSACTHQLQGKQYESYAYFNTATKLVIYDNFASNKRIKKADGVWADVKDILSNLENLFSVEIENSDLNKFNLSTGGEIVVDKHTYNVLAIAKEVYALTNGAFNPLLGIYVDLWGFSPRFSSSEYQPIKDYDRLDYENELPSQIFIDAFVPLTDFDAVNLKTAKQENDIIYIVEKPNIAVSVNGIEYTMTMNLGGIGKGYATDIIQQYLLQCGYEYGYINIGRSSLGLLKNVVKIPSAPVKSDWKVGLINPNNPQNQYADIFLQSTTVSTSGDYENYYEINNKRYSHIIDNKTFYPIDSTISSVTIVGQSAAYGDALSTALCVLSLQDAIALSKEKLHDYQVVITNKDASVYSKTAKDNFVLTDKEFELKSWG